CRVTARSQALGEACAAPDMRRPLAPPLLAAVRQQCYTTPYGSIPASSYTCCHKARQDVGKTREGHQVATKGKARKPEANSRAGAAEMQAMKAERPVVDPAWLKALEWRCIGPFRGGRVVAVAGDPINKQVFYFGSTGGGVWKTTDGGVYWENVSDGSFRR